MKIGGIRCLERPECSEGPCRNSRLRIPLFPACHTALVLHAMVNRVCSLLSIAGHDRLQHEKLGHESTGADYNSAEKYPAGVKLVYPAGVPGA